MKFKEVLKNAKANGITIEKALVENIDWLDEMLCVIEEEHPEMHDRFMRELHEEMYGCHYDKHFAEMDVECIRFTARGGEKRHGAHWNVDQIQDTTKSMSFSNKTTMWDKYVAFNSFYADTCTIMDEVQILETAHKFYFADEDAPDGKIWRYMSAMHYNED